MQHCKSNLQTYGMPGFLYFACLVSVAWLAIFLIFPANVFAATQTQNNSVNVSGIVSGPPPSTPPAIDAPVQSTTFSQKNIEIKGSCATNLVVKVFRNTTFAGSVLCGSDATYSLKIDLIEGRNDLVARQYDTLNRPSPESDTVTVYYLSPSQQPALPSQGGSQSNPPASQIAKFQLLINYDYTQQAIFVGRPFRLPIHFSGGTSPYAVSVDWGDGKSTIVSRPDSAELITEHIYEQAGPHKIVVRISDRDGNEAFMQFVVIVNGPISIGNLLTNAGQNLTWSVIALGGAIVGFGFFGGVFASWFWQKKSKKV